jgi:methyl-accepting chemotaxis protein
MDPDENTKELEITKEKAQQFELLSAGQKKAVADILFIAEKVKSGDLSARIDLTHHTGDFEKIAEGINTLLDAFTEKNNWYKAIIDAVPFPIHVIDMDMKWALINTAFEKLLVEQGYVKNREAGIGMPCSTANATICNTDKCGIQQLHKGITESFFDWCGASCKQTTSFLRDQKGAKIGYVEVVQDLTSMIAVRDFTKAEVDRMAANLSHLAEGNLDFDLTVKPADEFTRDEHDDFVKMNENMKQVQQAVGALIGDATMLASAAVEGKLANRADATRHQGDYRMIIEGFNKTLDAIIAPLNVAIHGYDIIGKGDIPEKRTNKVNGDIIGMQKSMNTCIDNINALITDAEMLAEGAIEGNLANRADATRHQGDYRKIIEGFNRTLDAVIEPVDEAMRVAYEFSEYNYQARMDKNLRVVGDFVKFRDALDNIGISVSTAIGDINNHVTDLAASAEEANASIEEVVSGAQQVAESAGKVSSNAEKGNQGLEQVLKAMEDLSAAVEEVTASSESVANLANNANTLSKDGAELARKAEQGMVGITRSTTEVDQIIGEIKVEMQKIGKIVGLISDLANQTNLLALNAAIEAARAGDAGRGFAVVAAEVKSLAQESRTSAESIAEMIGGLQHKSELAAQATASASKEVGEGSAVLSETLKVFNRIVGDIEKITRSVGEVASASEEQAATVEEITASVHEVSNLVDGTASDAGDAAAASEESSAAIDEVGKIIENVNVIVDSVSSGINKFRV